MNSVPQPSKQRGWAVVLAALSINLILGALYAWGVTAKALVAQWGWTKMQAALPFTVSTAAFALMMIFAGRLQDKIGPRFVALAGGTFFGGGLMLSSLVRSPSLMLITFGIIGGMGIGLAYSATTPPAIKWFPSQRKGFITGIVVSGVGLAAVYVSPLTQFLLKRFGIEQTFLLLGIGALLLIAVLSQVLRNPPASSTSAAKQIPGAPVAMTGRHELDWREMLTTPQFYQLWTMFVLAAAAGLMIIAHVAIIAKEQASWEWGFIPVATLALFNTSGRIFGGFLSDRIGRTRTMILAFVLQAANMLAFRYYTNSSMLIFGSAFTGLCYGTFFTTMPAATADFYGLKNLGVNYGFIFTSFGVAGVVGPILAGAIRDHSGSYGPAYLICAVLLLVGAALAGMVKPPSGRELSPQPASEKTEAVLK